MPMSVTPTRWVTVPCWLKGMPWAAAPPAGVDVRASALSTTARRGTLERQLEADAHRAPRAVEAPRTEERVEVGAQRLGLLGNRVDVIAVAEALLHALQRNAVDRGRTGASPLRAITEIDGAVRVELANRLRLGLKRQAGDLRTQNVRPEQRVIVGRGLGIGADMVGEVEQVARISIKRPSESPSADAFRHSEVQGFRPG